MTKSLTLEYHAWLCPESKWCTVMFRPAVWCLKIQMSSFHVLWVSASIKISSTVLIWYRLAQNSGKILFQSDGSIDDRPSAFVRLRSVPCEYKANFSTLLFSTASYRRRQSSVSTLEWMEDSVCLLSASAQYSICLQQLKRCSQSYHVQSHIYIDLRLSVSKDFFFRRQKVPGRTSMLCSLPPFSKSHLVRLMSVASASRFKLKFLKMFKFCCFYISIISFDPPS